MMRAICASLNVRWQVCMMSLKEPAAAICMITHTFEAFLEGTTVLDDIRMVALSQNMNLLPQLQGVPPLELQAP